jgi:cell division protease FtsH
MPHWLILIAIAVFVWLYFSGKGGAATQRGVLSFGKSRARKVTSQEITFKDVAGVDAAQEELQEVVDFLTSPERYTKIGAHIPKGVLLVGAPGTGKTLLARAVAGEAAVPFFQLSGSDFVEMFVGVGAARVRDSFKKARESAPCIIFIDELDALGKARSTGGVSHEEREQTLNQLLVEMDGFDPSIGVIVMAATNRPEILDGALLRAGRFDRHITVDLPERAGRKAILEIHARNVTLDEGVDLDEVAQRTPGFAGADLANLINEAALLTARARKEKVTLKELDEAVERATLGLEKKGVVLTSGLRRLVAYHELGHAVVAECRPHADPVKKVSIVPRGMGLGVTWQAPSEESRHLKTESQLRDEIAVLLGGRAAELIFIGEASTGAHDDLARATQMASDMVRKYGMSKLGSRTYERARAGFVNQDATPSSPRQHGETAADQIDQAVGRIVEDSLQQAIDLLKSRRDDVEALVEKLLETQSLSGEELREFLGIELPPKAT